MVICDGDLIASLIVGAVKQSRIAMPSRIGARLGDGRFYTSFIFTYLASE
jgi:hypothetical protein